MSLNLVEDSEAFEAALHFVDEFVACGDCTDQRSEDDVALTRALDGLPSPTELALVETQTEAPAAKTSAKTKARKVSKPKRPLNYNPNRAREQQRKELLYLREKVVEMEQELNALQSTRRPKTLTEVEGDKQEDERENVALAGFNAPEVWKEMASHQLEQRLKSERENRRLKAVLEGQIKIGKSLAKLLEATSTTQPMESCVYGPQRTRRMHASAPDRTGPGIFAELMAGVDDSYREVDDVFRANGLGEMESSFSDAKMRVGPDGVYMEIFANKVLPFDVASTGTAAWQYFAKSMEHMPFRFFYQKDPQNLETTDDTIVESFGMELHANGTQADFRVKEVLRRYVDEDRVVIVWRSFIDPVEFSGAPLRGAEFREKGYIVIRRPRGMAENYALLQTCYLIHPDTPVHSLSDDGAITAIKAEVKGPKEEKNQEEEDVEAHAVWKEMASHQLEQRLKSERENRQLKLVLEGQIKIAKSLEKLLQARATTNVGRRVLLDWDIMFLMCSVGVLQAIESCLGDGQRLKRMHMSTPDRSDASIFKELMEGIDSAYREVDAVFRDNGLDTKESSFSDAEMHEGADGVYMKIFASKVLPFDVVSTGTAAWRYFSRSLEHMPFRFLYHKDLQNVETTDDTIIESFGMELHAKGTQADYRVKQIVRRYVEENRVVIVWRSYIDPVSFAGNPVYGAQFQEKGYLVVRRPRAMSPRFALLQTCYLISPALPIRSLSDERSVTGELTDFVLSGTEANVASCHQMIENILFNEAMKAHSKN
ncbi:Cytochrome P450 86A2 [Phytophthora nicotianae]|uniref:Cytochrome P450 86A2 n=1 Tax=Phytophthora nicotianae TaxID=4792 RepID=A0A0W8CYR1_PHYNI|nr:Cytochrome P450 86A2 [Phytophthora nicotianae]